MYYRCAVVTFLEPGYYEDGQFGIRIENVVLIKPVETTVSKTYKNILYNLLYTSHFSITLEIKLILLWSL